MKKFLFLLFVPIFNLNLYANPNVTLATTTGATFHRGDIVTINVTGHGTKSPAPPIIWADFEDGSINPSSKGQNSSWNVIQSLTRITTGTPFGDSTAMAAGGITAGNSSLSFETDLSVWSTWYFYTNVRHDYDPLGNEKIVCRLWSPGFSLPDYVMSTSNGGIALNEIDTNYPNRFCGGGSCGLTWSKNIWDEYRWYGSHGTIVSNSPPGDVGDGTSVLWQSGTRHINQNDVPHGSNTLTLMIMGNFCSSGVDCPAPGNIFYDNIYLDSVYSRVELSTTSTYAASTFLKPQIIQTWSSSQVTAEMFLGDVSGSAVLYAYVTDAQNNTNSIGTQITQSGTPPISSPYPIGYPVRR